MRLKKVMLLAICFVLLFNVSIVSAKNTKANVNWDERRAFIEENMILIGSQGPEKVDEWLKANGVYKSKKVVALQPETESILPLSSPGSVSLNNITGYFDTIAKKYIIKGWWNWLTSADSTAGALDGVSIAMCQTNWNPVTGYQFASYPTGIAVYDQYGTHYPYAGNASKIDKSGILYTFQDSWYQGRYCGHKGQVWAWLTLPPSQSPIYLKMDYQHTWSSASLSSYGFTWPAGSAPTINMQFNVVPSNFKVANQVTLSSWPQQ